MTSLMLSEYANQSHFVEPKEKVIFEKITGAGKPAIVNKSLIGKNSLVRDNIRRLNVSDDSEIDFES